jgi:hypothetical protein
VQDAEDTYHWDRGEERRAPEIRTDQYRASLHPIDDNTDKWTQYEPGQADRGGQDTKLCRSGVQVVDGDERQGQAGERRAECGNRLPSPEFEEVGMKPQARVPRCHGVPPFSP